MRSGRLRAVLSALLPRSTRRDLFEPAALDLDADRLRAGRRPPRLGLVLLFLDCWRLTPAEVFSMFLNDLRHAFRLLYRDPAFALTALLTLTLGVGANVTVFGIFDAVLLRPLPYSEADQLVILEHRDRRTGIKKEFIAIGDYADIHARQTVFETLGGYGTVRTVVHGTEDPLDVAGLTATADALMALRLVPYAGRAINDGDGRQGAAPVVMLGYDLWQTRFAADPTIVGRSLKIGITPVMRQVVGIAPPGFSFPAGSRTDLIFPATLPAEPPSERKSSWTFGIARLKPGVGIEQAEAQLVALSQQMEQEHPTQNQGSEYHAIPIRDAMVGESGSALMLMLSAVALVLLIACANVANLLAARSLGRRQEMALRVALGAGKRQIAMQLVAESVALASVAGGCAVLFAYWATPALVSLVPASMNVPALSGVRVDGRVLLFAAGISVATTLVFSMFSALGMRRDNTAGAIVSPNRTTTGTAVRRATSVLVAAEIALAIVLLASAGLVLRSFSNLLSVDPGFTSDGVLTLAVSAPSDRYRDANARAIFQQRMFEAIRSVPGVEDAGAAAVMPLTGNNWTVPFERADRPVPAGQRPPDVGWQSATGGYFRALRIPLRAGRYFSAADTPSGPPVVIISEAIQQQFFPGENAVGRKVKLGSNEAEIVGVVGNIRRAALTDTPRADLYFAAEQQASVNTGLFIRTSVQPTAIVPALRSALRAVEPGMVLRLIRPMEVVLRESVTLTQLTLWLLGIFAAAALALAAVGIYGVMSYMVRGRTREIGTRMALGATPAGILWLVLSHGARIASIGTVIGLAISFAAGRALRSLLFDTSPADPWALLVAAFLLLTTALVACYLPARRATRVDPVRTLVSQ